MIADALSAELLKLSRNRWTAFWAFAFPPIAGLVFGVLTALMAGSAGEGLPPLPAAPLTDVLNGLGLSGNVVANLFLIAGAASLFAGEYRWETWRAILPRTERSAILIGKMATFAIAISLSIAASGFAGVLVGFFETAISGLAPNWPSIGLGATLLTLGAAFAISLAQALWIAALVAALAVTTRSLMAATIGTFVVLIAFGVLATTISQDDLGLAIVTMPNVASGLLRASTSAALNGAPLTGGEYVAASAIVLPLSAAFLFAFALLVFRRQDLARE